MTVPILTHTDAEQLLPELLAGSLTDMQSRAMRAHVSSCLDCRREQKHLALIKVGLLDNTTFNEVPRPDPARVLQRIDDYEERRARNPFLRFMRFGREHPIIAMAAQAVMILLAVLLIVPPFSHQPEFTTLSQAENLPAGFYVRAVFEPDLTGATVTELVGSLELRVVDGPSERGVYTLAAPAATGATDYISLANALRANNIVLFAEVVNIGDAR